MANTKSTQLKSIQSMINADRGCKLFSKPSSCPGNSLVKVLKVSTIHFDICTQ